jgi:hypothetical protein
MNTLKSDIFGQLARNTNLLPESQSSEILAGNMPPLEDIIMPLLIGTIDCEALTAAGSNSTWTERRLSRQCLILAFLLAIVAAQE